jgi:hypothetical protein
VSLLYHLGVMLGVSTLVMTFFTEQDSLAVGHVLMVG